MSEIVVKRLALVHRMLIRLKKERNLAIVISGKGKVIHIIPKDLK